MAKKQNAAPISPWEIMAYWDWLFGQKLYTRRVLWNITKSFRYHTSTALLKSTTVIISHYFPDWFFWIHTMDKSFRLLMPMAFCIRNCTNLHRKIIRTSLSIAQLWSYKKTRIISLYIPSRGLVIPFPPSSYLLKYLGTSLASSCFIFYPRSASFCKIMRNCISYPCHD